MKKGNKKKQFEFERYSRQIFLIGNKQEALRKSKALVLGLGGLGSPVAFYLAAAGINLGLVDKDKVSLENLNRQILFTEREVGKAKVNVARKRLKEINSEIKIKAYKLDLLKTRKTKLKEIFSKYDVIVDCLDNLKAKFLAYEIAKEFKKPFVYAAIEELYGFQSTFMPNSKNKLEKIYKQRETTQCLSIIGPVAGFIASFQALEVIKILTGIGKINDKLLIFNCKDNRLEFVEF